MENGHVFILESTSHTDKSVGRTGIPSAESITTMLGIECESRSIETVDDLISASDLFRECKSTSLLLTAHGCPDGFELTDGTLVQWDTFFKLFQHDDHYALIMSSCSTLATEAIHKAALSISKPPMFMYGHGQSVGWSEACIFTLLVLRSLHRARCEILSGAQFQVDFISCVLGMFISTGDDVRISTLDFESCNHYTHLTGLDMLIEFVENAESGNFNRFEKDLLTARIEKYNNMQTSNLQGVSDVSKTT